MKNYKSQRGVYFDTKDSTDYFFVYSNYKFYFSSLFNLNRFKDRVCKYTFEENSKIVNKYRVDIELIDYFIFSLYKSIEKRGYKIQDMETSKYIVNGKTINLAFTCSLAK